MTMWVKICGITRHEEALQAIEAGADAIGLNFVSRSPRCLSRKAAEEILRGLPAALTVGVVANEDPSFVKELLRVCPVKAIQFHGEEPPMEVLILKEEGIKVIKAIRVKGPKSLEQIPLYQGVDAVLLDTFDPNRRGGTGAPFDWSLAVQAREFRIPIIIAGGLNPENVREAVRQARPYGVDVASGVEASPGRKDPLRVREFVLNAKQV